MTRSVSLRDVAENDLARARDWYDKQRPGLGDELLSVVAECLLSLESTPELHPIYYRGFRRVLTRRFPYKLFFRIEGEAVVVFRILHASRDHTRQLGER